MSYGLSGSYKKLPSFLYALVSNCTFQFLNFSNSQTPDAPARLKKELDAVLKLQTTIDTTDDAISRLADRFSKSTLDSLARTQDRLKDKVEQLYASLNIQESFPELEDIDLDFIKLLVLARDLKINIRKRAIGSFFEWDRLDQAAGGRQHAIGLSFCMLDLRILSNTTLKEQKSTKTLETRLPNASQLFSGLFENLTTTANN